MPHHGLHVVAEDAPGGFVAVHGRAAPVQDQDRVGEEVEEGRGFAEARKLGGLAVGGPAQIDHHRVSLGEAAGQP